MTYAYLCIAVALIASLAPSSVGAAPAVGPQKMLPDLRFCCGKAGVKYDRCVDNFFDVTKNEIDVTKYDPRMNDVLTCLANLIHKDVTPCCTTRGVDRQCSPLCNGRVQPDHTHFDKCLHYMNTYSNCFIREYGVLPGVVTSFHLKSRNTNRVVVVWPSPQVVPRVKYNMHYKIHQSGDVYKVVTGISSPYELRELQADTEYDMYLEPVNMYGVGDPSPTFQFETLTARVFDEEQTANNNDVISDRARQLCLGEEQCGAADKSLRTGSRAAADFIVVGSVVGYTAIVFGIGTLAATGIYFLYLKLAVATAVIAR